jgi:hypothetical protein
MRVWLFRCIIFYLAPENYLFSGAKHYILLEQGSVPLEMFEEDMYA